MQVGRLRRTASAGTSHTKLLQILTPFPAAKTCFYPFHIQHNVTNENGGDMPQGIFSPNSKVIVALLVSDLDGVKGQRQAEPARKSHTELLQISALFPAVKVYPCPLSHLR